MKTAAIQGKKIRFNDSTSRIRRLVNELRLNLPGVYLYSVMLGANPNEDLFYSILGNLNGQVDELCKSLKQNANLTGGFNAIGLSQVSERSNPPKMP